MRMRGEAMVSRATIDRLTSPARRRWIRIALRGVAAGLTVGVVVQPAAQEKMSRREADYQDSPEDIRMCATCTLFLPPKSCKVVDGEVSPNGWCKLFVIAD
jgi:hypothetical protein